MAYSIPPQPLKITKSCEFEYENFVELFEKASEKASSACGLNGPAHPVSFSDQTDSLDWVARMALRGESFEQTEGPMWLGTCRASSDSDNDNEDEDEVACTIMLTPLAWAVIHGLPHVAEALLSHGADPVFKFNLNECGASDVDISVFDLAGGWAEVGYRSFDCVDLVRSAIEAGTSAEVAPDPRIKHHSKHL